MSRTQFRDFFKGIALDHLIESVQSALQEDGDDLTSNAVFSAHDEMRARIVAKQNAVVAGLPIAELVLSELTPVTTFSITYMKEDGDRVESGDVLMKLHGPARILLRAERVILNFLCHLSGIATLTRQYVDALGTSRTRLLDTRKTLPGLRYEEKYAVLAGGGLNHRMNLEEMLMLKDTHIDQCGSITNAVRALRDTYIPCPPIEVECRTMDEVLESVAVEVDRIMLDNMDLDVLQAAFSLIPITIETEVSGGVNLDTIADIGVVGPDFVSVGRITHSAPYCDFSMRTDK